MEGTVYQINIKPETPGERGLPKRSIEFARLTTHGLVGDFNRWRHEEHHDDPDMAVLLLSLETMVALQSEGWPVNPGDVGENLTTARIPYEHFSPGQLYQTGEALIQIAKACTPCGNLKHLHYVGQERKAAFIKTLVGRRGWYARVIREGKVTVGDRMGECAEEES